jgi:hypothetical protein
LKLKEICGRLGEATKDDKGKMKYPVVIISQGLGNLADRNYYSSEAIESGVDVYEGRKAYFDHPTETDSRERPGRSVRELAGHYENVKAKKDSEGVMSLQADFVPISTHEEVQGLLNHAIDYKKKYPDSDFVGISINGDGEGETLDWDQFVKSIKPNTFEMKKLAKIEGQQVNVIRKLTAAVSADLVTEPGARGRLLLEQEKKRRLTMFDKLKKLFVAIESKDEEMAEQAVKGMIQGEADEKKESAEASESDAFVKNFLACKKEMKKDAGESHEAFEMKCAKEAYEMSKKEMSKKDEKSDKEKPKDDEEMPEDEKKEASGEKVDGEKHDDEKQDIELIKKLMGKVEQLEAKMEAMSGEKESAKTEAKDAKESEAVLKIEKTVKERAELIDRVLAASKLSRPITNNIRPVLEKCRTEAEIKDTAKRLIETAKEIVDEMFLKTDRVGLTEMEATRTETTTDDLFKQ